MKLVTGVVYMLDTAAAWIFGGSNAETPARLRQYHAIPVVGVVDSDADQWLSAACHRQAPPLANIKPCIWRFSISELIHRVYFSR